MAKLKEEIRSYGCFDILEYTEVEDLGRVVYEKTIQQIQDLYPLQSKPDKLEVERDLHDNFAAFRSRCYVKIDKYFKRLDDFFNQMHRVTESTAEDERLQLSKPLVVFGNSGSGKSALVANWWMTCEDYLLQTYPKLLIVTHYVGATVDSTNHFALMRRIMLEIKAHLSLPQDVPIDPLQIQKEFPTYLNIVSARCPMLLILDALNQLEDRHQALSLNWLPVEFPANVRVIVSTTEVSPVLGHCRQLGYQELQVTNLDITERKQLIADYLKQYSKTLQASDSDFIVNSTCGGSPLFLRSLLEELRMDALYETLTNKIKYYCAAEDLERFFELMLQRFEIQYENEADGTHGVFGIIFVAIALSR
jgi:telomerase protein component 1